ncbi:NOD26-like intrinsic protein 7;1 [Actinidia rufa]|uniref:NOD26-like intrinsic protein 71 n=1 Tax=Actinidia rufa TaxID=165716 RepID=A0A7J0EJN8_9ERIC|nr:NOD26-like intrinsic protein 7;1 [Actinidia rufa]
MEEGKQGQLQGAATNVAASPNIHQKVVSVATYNVLGATSIIAEFLGTFVLIFAGCGAALVDREKKLAIVGIATVWGLVLMAIIYTLGHISGAHVNPAITIAFAAAHRLPLKEVPMYVLAQLLGATLASLALKLLFNHQRDISPTLTHYSSSTTDLQAIAWEFIITFILMLIICGVATGHRAKQNKGISGVAIGATVLANALVAGKQITGVSMNPARSIGPALVSGVYKNLWVYVVAPILGAMAATFTYSLLRLPKQEKYKEKTKTINNDVYADP